MDAKILPAYLMPYPVESFSKPILIPSDRTFIGRGVDGGIQIADRRISRNHACIQFNEGHFWIEDLESHNGTFLNNKRIRQARLNHRDKISIVDRTFLFLYRQASVYELMTEPSVEATDTIPISIEEIALSDFWAQSVNHAARKFIESAGSEASSWPQFDRLAHERLSLLYRLSENLRSTDSIDTVYDQGTDLMLDAIHGAKCVLIAVRSPTRDSFKVVSCKFRKPHEEGDNIPVSHTLFDWVISENVTLISQNLRDDDRFTDSESIRIHDLRSIICVPITATKQAMGLLYLQASDQLDPFNKADAVFASAVANEMALTIENLRLHKQLI
ncbi:MAG: FHA domain-containing protein, partial [Desulfosarcina sp.]